MRTFCLLLLSSVFLFFFNSCEVCSCKKVTCPAFNDPEFTDWFPYTLNQKIIFRNNILRDTITIAVVDKSASYDANKGCYNGDIGCFMDYQSYSGEIQPDYSSKFSVSFRAQTPFESANTAKNIAMKFYNFSFSASGITNQGLLIDPGIYSSQYYASLDIAGKTYSNVQMIMKDTAGSIKITGPYKIYLEQNLGIIGYEDYPSLATWIKE